MNNFNFFFVETIITIGKYLYRIIENNLIFGVERQRVSNNNYPIISLFPVYSPYNGYQLNLTNVIKGLLTFKKI